MTHHAKKKSQNAEAAITILEKQTKHQEKQIEVFQRKKGISLDTLHEEARQEDDSLRVLYDTNDPRYDSSEPWETDEWEGYYGNP